jgi:hypothetical protein
MPKKNTKDAPKVKPLPVTKEGIKMASETNAIKALVALADAYSRTALDGPFPTELPSFVSVFVGGEKQSYRKMNLGMGVKLMPDRISLGKRCGLIFAFKPHEKLERDGQPVDRIELNWDDVINYFGPLADKIEERLNRNREESILVSAINNQIKGVIELNPSMHKILIEGFALAQQQAREDANDESLEEIPGFGMF